jgi:uncharacterized membrane protein (DUF2068 family)
VATPSHTKGLRAVAVFEASKGLVLLAAGCGVLALLGRDVEHFATQVIHRFHLNPAHHYPQIFLEVARNVNNTHLVLLAVGAALYATVRFVEAYGLWHARRWAEWVAAVSGAIYVPIEIYELAVKVTWLRASALVLNLAIVGYMVWLLTERRRLARRESAADT